MLLNILQCTRQSSTTNNYRTHCQWCRGWETLGETYLGHGYFQACEWCWRVSFAIQTIKQCFRWEVCLLPWAPTSLSQSPSFYMPTDSWYWFALKNTPCGEASALLLFSVTRSRWHWKTWSRTARWQRSSVQSNSAAQSCPTLWPHELQHARPPCPSPTSGVYPSSCSLRRWCLLGPTPKILMQ